MMSSASAMRTNKTKVSPEEFADCVLGNPMTRILVAQVLQAYCEGGIFETGRILSAALKALELAKAFTDIGDECKVCK